MKKMSETIIFFGSGPVAAASLTLLSQHMTIEAVITKPSTLAEMSAASQTKNIYKVSNKKELTDLVTDKQFSSRLGIVIDFGIIIGQEVIDSFELGIVNSHFSLLPEWRGADPISFSLLSGQAKTGVSLMVIDAGLDTGKLIAQKSLNIETDDTSTSLTKKLIELSDDMIRQYLPDYFEGNIRLRSQPHPERATYSRKLTKEDGIIDWSKPATQLEREIRAYYTWPKSRTVLAGKEVIITNAYAVPGSTPGAKPGEITIIPETKDISVATGEGSLWIRRLKPAGKNEMTSEAFLAGHKNNL